MAATEFPLRAFPLRALVHGAGPTGALAALALADAGWEVSVRDPLHAGSLRARSRAYAFNHSSRRLLQRLGLWEPLTGCLEPFTALQLCDQVLDGAVPFASADLSPTSRRAGAGAVGWIAAHGPLMDVLLQHLAAHPSIHLQLGGEPQTAISPDPAPFQLVVAADGPASPHRQALGIGLWQRPYRQSCLTAQVELRGLAPGQAWELFRAEGPFAVLPLGPGQAQLVWSAPTERCRQLEQLSPTAFLDRLAALLPADLEPDALLDQPRVFPVALAVARRLSRQRSVLVGESAHRCHPVGGQGLNLCWRDVATLHRLARRVSAGRLRPDHLPGRYGRQRWPDLLLTLACTDLLVHLFSNRSPLLLPLRRLAVVLLSRLAPLRRLCLGVMTEGPCRPW